MVLPVTGSTHLIPALLLIYRPRKDERLSWPSWLTCSGWFTHISCRSSAGQGKFASQRSTFYHRATPPTNSRRGGENSTDGNLLRASAAAAAAAIQEGNREMQSAEPAPRRARLQAWQDGPRRRQRRRPSLRRRHNIVIS